MQGINHYKWISNHCCLVKTLNSLKMNNDDFYRINIQYLEL